MYLGIDGGGSKTAFALLDDDGTVLALHEEATCYYPETGLEAAREVLRRGAMAVLARANAVADDLRHAFIGLPAYGENSALQHRLDTLPDGFLPAGRYRCGNDMVCGWAGSLCAQDGISVVAGTGSIAYGEFEGRSARAGGWSELFGDEGSAYWIAREALNLFSRMSDGRAEKGPLYALLRAQLQLENDLDLCAHVHSTLGAQRSAVARFSRTAHAAAVEGDAQAAEIFVRAAKELAQLVVALSARLRIPVGTTLRISYSGGVFNAGDVILNPFRQALAEQHKLFQMVEPALPPVIGAALYAAAQAGRPLSADALARLIQNSRR
ncbi:MAG TPA: BadF/BadG/BcrA/BcrD ATPase family protein [Burkholderiaceae bacterium]